LFGYLAIIHLISALGYFIFSIAINLSCKIF